MRSDERGLFARELNVGSALARMRLLKRSHRVLVRST
jgi:hypothetical protein